MSNDKRPRGRPRGSGKDDVVYLAEIADLLIRDPSLKPTAAMKQVMIRHTWTETDETLIRRWQVKWKATGPSMLAAAHERSQTASDAVPNRLPDTARILTTMNWQDPPINQMVKQVQDSIANSPIIQMAKEVQDTIANSPIIQMVKQVQDSIANSAISQIMKQVQDSIANSPINQMMKDLAESPLTKLMSDTRQQATWMDQLKTSLERVDIGHSAR
jgi:iron-sulfur cluster repair protein YtfE (RIC family)